MRYGEFPPDARLARWVHCVWTFQAEEPNTAPDRIVPDGRAELVLHLGAPFLEIGPDGRARPQPRAILAGQVTRPLHLRSPAAAEVVGVRFRPAGARAFVGTSMRGTTDRRIALDDLAHAWGSGTVQAVAAKRDLAARVDAVQQRVLDRKSVV